jgi:hypothetical protein
VLYLQTISTTIVEITIPLTWSLLATIAIYSGDEGYRELQRMNHLSQGPMAPVIVPKRELAKSVAISFFT